MITLSKSTRPTAGKDTLYIVNSMQDLRQLDVERNDRQYLIEQLKVDPLMASLDISGRLVLVHMVQKGERPHQLEKARCAGDKMAIKLNSTKRRTAQLVSLQNDPELTLAMAEGVVLSSYAFSK
ncbi:MAG: hypothetical protein IPI91_01315 [Flavobacteriales bacterium]|nr:hypothetical protein [Flavobacteriales bacterium]